MPLLAAVSFAAAVAACPQHPPAGTAPPAAPAAPAPAAAPGTARRDVTRSPAAQTPGAVPDSPSSSTAGRSNVTPPGRDAAGASGGGGLSE